MATTLGAGAAGNGEFLVRKPITQPRAASTSYR